MPNSIETPSARRFIHPSHSSHPSQRVSSERKQQGAPSTQSISSSSPFVRTPYLGRAEEIETSFEDGVVDSPPPLVSNRPQRLHHDHRHVISDDDDESGTERQRLSDTHLDPNKRNHGENGLTAFVPVDAIETFKADFSSPLPKRQKVSHFANKETDTIRSSSPLSADDNNCSPAPVLNINPVIRNTHESKVTDGPADHHLDEDEMDDVDVALSAKPRFRLMRHDLAPATNPISEVSRSQGPRAMFKGSPATSALMNGSRRSETPLPGTFSPSKRKGRYEYVAGGAAETVRGWILDIANHNNQNNDEIYRAGQGGQDNCIEIVATDPSGRFEVVRDDHGQEWMLVHQEEHRTRATSIHATGDGGTGMGQSLILKGTQTTWDLELPIFSPDSRKMSADNSIRVAVSWDLRQVQREFTHKT